MCPVNSWIDSSFSCSFIHSTNVYSVTAVCKTMLWFWRAGYRQCFGFGELGTDNALVLESLHSSSGQGSVAQNRHNRHLVWRQTFRSQHPGYGRGGERHKKWMR